MLILSCSLDGDQNSFCSLSIFLRLCVCVCVFVLAIHHSQGNEDKQGGDDETGWYGLSSSLKYTLSIHAYVW